MPWASTVVSAASLDAHGKPVHVVARTDVVEAVKGKCRHCLSKQAVFTKQIQVKVLELLGGGDVKRNVFVHLKLPRAGGSDGCFGGSRVVALALDLLDC